MQATQFAKLAMENGKNWVMGLIADMKDSPLTHPTANGGNHPLWVLGHLVYSESQLFDVFIQGKENRYPELATAFGMQSQPTSNATDYPSMDDLLEKFTAIRAESLAYLDSLSESDLDRETGVAEDMAPFFGTVGACYAAIANHQMFHGGQVADARRAAGRPALMA